MHEITGRERNGKRNCMRILVVGAVLGGTVPIGGSIYRAFKEMGVEADFLERPSR